MLNQKARLKIKTWWSSLRESKSSLYFKLRLRTCSFYSHNLLPFHYGRGTRPLQHLLVEPETLCTGADRNRSDMYSSQPFLTTADPRPASFFLTQCVFVILSCNNDTSFVCAQGPRRTTPHGTGGHLPPSILSLQRRRRRSSSSSSRRRRGTSTVSGLIKCILNHFIFHNSSRM